MAVLAAVEESKTVKTNTPKTKGKDGWGDNRVRMDGATIW